MNPRNEVARLHRATESTSKEIQEPPDFTWSSAKANAPPSRQYTTSFTEEWKRFIAELPEPHKTMFSLENFENVFFEKDAMKKFMAIRRQLCGNCSSMPLSFSSTTLRAAVEPSNKKKTTRCSISPRSFEMTLQKTSRSDTWKPVSMELALSISLLASRAQKTISIDESFLAKSQRMRIKATVPIFQPFTTESFHHLQGRWGVLGEWRP